MLNTIKFALVVASFGLLVACGGKGADAPAAAPAAAPAPATTVATANDQHGHGAEPGSHEDWCGEHGVPESECSRCNSALAAAFKATGDWCPEHGLPESQCLKCNPELQIIRPPKTVK